MVGVSGLLHPKGPEPASVYWRRRMTLGGGIVAVLVLAGLQIGANEPNASPTTGIEVSASSTPLATDISAPTTAATEVPTSEPTTTDSGPARCSKADLKVTAKIDRTKAAVGEGLHITMSVTNTSATACVRNLGSGVNEVAIVSGETTVWSSDYCNPSTAKKDTTLSAGETWAIEVVWNGKITRTGCDVRGKAPAGTYYATARNGKLTAAKKRFTIR